MQKYVNFEKLPNGNLRITLTEEGHETIREWMADCGSEDTQNQWFPDLIEYQLCNGWEWISPEECGALTDALIVTDAAERDEDGEIVRLGRVYTNINYYQIEGDIPRLLRLGELIWTSAE